MLILDELVKIGEVEDKIKYASKLYQHFFMFKKYIDIAYDNDFVARYGINDVPFPKYTQSMVPHGYNYSNLECQFGGIVSVGYIPLNGKDIIGDGRAGSRLIQIFSSLSEIEVVFLKSVLMKSVDILPLENWKEIA